MYGGATRLIAHGRLTCTGVHPVRVGDQSLRHQGRIYSLAFTYMFNVFYLSDDGAYVFVSKHHDEDDADIAVDALSDRMPNAYCDYVYQDTH